MLLPLSAETRSALPSPLKSATETHTGVAPEVKECLAAKVPSPLPRNTLNVPVAKPAETRSALPSPLKSATETEWGHTPEAKDCLAAKVPSPLPTSTLNVLPASVSRYEVSFAVAVKVGH